MVLTAMRSKHLLILTIILISILEIQTGTSQSLYAYSTWNTPNQQVSPGERGVQLLITIVNSQTPLYNVTVTPQVSFPLTLYNYYNGSPSFFFPYLAPFQQVEIPLLVSVSPLASLGVYNEFLLVSYYTQKSSIQYQNITFQVQITGNVSFVLNSLWGTPSSPQTSFPGAIDLPLTIEIQNTGSVTATNVSLMLQNVYPVSFKQTFIQVGSLPSGVTEAINVIASIYQNASSGVFYVPVKVNYFNTSQVLRMPIFIQANFTPQLMITNSQFTGAPNSKGNTLFLSFEYVSPVPLSMIEITLNLPRGFHNITGGNVIDVKQPVQGDEGSSQFTVNVDLDQVSKGTYFIYGKAVLYAIQGGVIRQYTQNISFPIHVLGEERILVYSSNYNLIQGRLNNVTLIISNLGSGDAYNLSVTLSSQGAGILNSTFSIGYLKEGRETSLVLPVFIPQSTLSSLIPIVVTINYFNAYGLRQTYSETLYFYTMPIIKNPNPILISPLTTTIPSSTLTNVTLKVINIANYKLNNISISLSSPQGYVYPSSLQINSLNPDQSVSFNLEVYTNSQSNFLSIQANVLYYDNFNVLNQEINNVNLLISEQVQLQLIQSIQIPSIATKGDIVSVTGTLVNRGAGTAYGVIVYENAQSNFIPISGNTYYIGNIAPNSLVTFTFSFLVSNSSKAGNYTIPVVISYENNLNHPFNLSLNLPMNVGENTTSTLASRQFAFGFQFIIIIALIVVIIALFLYIIIRRGRK